VMAGANYDAIVVAFEGVHVCSLVLCVCAPFPEVSKLRAGSEKYRILCAKASRRKEREGAPQRLRGLLASARAKFSANSLTPYRHGRPIGENEGWPEA
jgi:hypothetical protein